MNKYWRYILTLLLLLAACNAPFMPEIPTVPEDGTAESRTDAEDRDARVYHQNSLDTIGPGKDGAFWMNDQEISVSTDFPAPSWFR
jgi:hypothetical protein